MDPVAFQEPEKKLKQYFNVLQYVVSTQKQITYTVSFYVYLSEELLTGHVFVSYV